MNDIKNTPVPGLNDLADFEDITFPYHRILNWARNDDGGGLPDVSAEPFAAWLNQEWSDYDDGSGKMTNEDVLKGALAFWTGQA